MNQKPLAMTIRAMAAVVVADDSSMRDVAELLRILARVLEGMPIAKAFGAPGDWGYETEIGQGVIALLSGKSP